MGNKAGASPLPFPPLPSIPAFQAIPHLRSPFLFLRAVAHEVLNKEVADVFYKLGEVMCLADTLSPQQFREDNN